TSLSCVASGATVTLGDGGGGSFTVSFTAAPNAPGTFANPASGGVCTVDPSNVVAEEDETNNSCSDSVVVTKPDLTVTKTNDVNGVTTWPSTGWTWTLKVSNPSLGPVTFSAGQVILQDDLPLGATYTGQAPGSFINITNSANLL